MIPSKNLKKQSTEQHPKEEADFSEVDKPPLLPAKVEWCVLGLCSILFFCVPLFYLSLSKCHKCGKEPDQYYTASINDQIKTMDLCEDCSRDPIVTSNLLKDKWKKTTAPPIELLARNVFSLPLRSIPNLISVRTVNAEYKLALFLAFASLLIGIVACSLHLKKRLLFIPRPLVIFTGLFLGSVLLSSIFAHNFQRAWVSSILWHFIPVFFAISLAHIKWRRKKIVFCLSSLLVGGIVSCLITMDQHYRWTDWAWQLPLHSNSAPAGLIYNPNFAAEYHAPLLPITLGLIFYIRSIGCRIALGLALAFVLFPALALSLARGAWVGLMGGCILTLVLFFFAWITQRNKNLGKTITRKSFMPIGALLALGLMLPVYIYTSASWKKNTISTSPSSPTTTISTEAKELESITEISDASGGSGRRLVLWQDALRACLSLDLIMGKGTDHYELHFHESAILSDKTTGGTLVRFVHNDFIQTLYENGLIGLIGFLGIWGWAIWKGLLSSLKRAREADIHGLGLRLGLISASLVFLEEAFFEFPTRSPCALMLGWAILGVLLGVLLNERLVSKPISFSLGPRLNLALGSLGVLIIPYGCLLAKDLFWTNVYHVQGRVAGDYGDKDKSLSFHQKAISYAPWEHHSRKFECYYLLTHTKQIPQAMEAIDSTLDVHPSCLVAHQNKIALYLNTGQIEKARKAFLEMQRVAPYHPFTHNEDKRTQKKK